MLRVSKINEWGKEHKWDNLMKCDYNNIKSTPRVTTTTSSTPSPSPAAVTVASTQATTQVSRQATTKATSPTTTTRATSAATRASQSCEVTLVPKDSDWYLKQTVLQVTFLCHRLYVIDYNL